MNVQFIAFMAFIYHPKQQQLFSFFFKNKPRRMSKRKKQKKIPIQCHEINGSVHLAAIFNKVYKKTFTKKKLPNHSLSLIYNFPH